MQGEARIGTAFEIPTAADLKPNVRAALLENDRLKLERARRLDENPRPRIGREMRELNDIFRNCLKVAKANPNVNAARDGAWVRDSEQLPTKRAAELRHALGKGATLLHDAARASGTNAQRERHLRDWMLFCRILRVSPYMTSREDCTTLHKYISWKGLFYSKANHKAGAPLGVQHGTLANEVSSIRTFHHEIMGVDLAKIDPLLVCSSKG